MTDKKKDTEEPGNTGLFMLSFELILSIISFASPEQERESKTNACMARSDTFSVPLIPVYRSPFSNRANTSRPCLMYVNNQNDRSFTPVHILPILHIFSKEKWWVGGKEIQVSLPTPSTGQFLPLRSMSTFRRLQHPLSAFPGYPCPWTSETSGMALLPYSARDPQSSAIYK